ncbi:HK97-gp10 family putative phage morphogenesis protein [Moraxella marmotae]
MEYGTSKMPAVPFIRPSFDKNKEKAVQIFTERLKNNIDKAIGSGWLPK